MWDYCHKTVIRVLMCKKWIYDFQVQVLILFLEKTLFFLTQSECGEQGMISVVMLYFICRLVSHNI